MSEFTQNYLLLCLYIRILTIFIPFVVLFVMVRLVSVSGESAAGPRERKALEF